MESVILPFSPIHLRPDPYAYYAELRLHAPVHFFESGFWTISKHKDVETALQRPDLFSSRRPNWASTPVSEDPPLHTKLRKSALKILSLQKIPASLEQRIREINDEILQAIPFQQEFDLMSTVADWLPFNVISEIMAIPKDIRVECFHWMRTLTHSPVLENQLAGLALWDTEELELSSEERVRFVRFLLSAASITTRNLIGNAILALLKNPDQMRLIRDDRARIASAVEEALRYEAPTQMADRRTTKNVEISGITIPAGSTVFLLLGSANRDPEVFEDPDAFLITRDTSRHLAFGEGPHYCLGAHLAKLEAQIALETFIFRLEGLRPAQSLESLNYLDTILLRGLKSFNLIFDSAAR